MSAPRMLRAEVPVSADWHRPRARPYVWRDRARMTPQRAAELAAIERRDWGGCDRCYKPWHLCRCPAV